MRWRRACSRRDVELPVAYAVRSWLRACHGREPRSTPDRMVGNGGGDGPPVVVGVGSGRRLGATTGRGGVDPVTWRARPRPRGAVLHRPSGRRRRGGTLRRCPRPCPTVSRSPRTVPCPRKRCPPSDGGPSVSTSTSRSAPPGAATATSTPTPPASWAGRHPPTPGRRRRAGNWNSRPPSSATDGPSTRSSSEGAPPPCWARTAWSRCWAGSATPSGSPRTRR